MQMRTMTMPDIPFPIAFKEQMNSLLETEAEAFWASYSSVPLRGIRFRSQRVPLSSKDIGRPIPYARHAFFLSSDSQAGAHPLHDAGAYYIQEPSAMAAAAVLHPEDGDCVLDLCAAPGGKSTQLAMSAALRLLVANEPMPARAQVLSGNIERMGIPIAVVTCAFPDALASKWPGFFDKVLVDAPCSGEGMFRRHPETRLEWTADAPARCHARQLEILRSAAKLLKAGGRMVYSTCTFNRTENEGTVLAFLTEHPHFRLLPIHTAGLPEASDGMLRLWPHRFSGEGHFVALLEKTEPAPHEAPSAAPEAPLTPSRNESAIYSAFAQEIGCTIRPNHLKNDRLFLVPDLMPALDKLRVLRLGLHLGQIRGKNFFPDHALALANPMQKRFPIQAHQAQAYLHGDTLDCPEAFSGYYAIEYMGYQMGFGKASGGQMKNHYPKGLRRSL